MGRINQLTPTTIVTTDSVIAVDAANGGVTNKLTINTLAGGLRVIGNYATQTQLAAKQDVLTFDDAPEEDSDNPVTSGGIYNAIGSAMSNVYTKAETDSAIQQSTATGGSDYVKLPDGTMIEYGYASYNIATSIKTYSIQFGHQFVDIPVVTVSTGAGGARVPVYTESVGKTGFELVFAAHSTTSTSWARWMAIGHWK